MTGTTGTCSQADPQTAGTTPRSSGTTPMSPRPRRRPGSVRNRNPRPQSRRFGPAVTHSAVFMLGTTLPAIIIMTQLPRSARLDAPRLHQAPVSAAVSPSRVDLRPELCPQLPVRRVVPVPALTPARRAERRRTTRGLHKRLPAAAARQNHATRMAPKHAPAIITARPERYAFFTNWIPA